MLVLTLRSTLLLFNLNCFPLEVSPWSEYTASGVVLIGHKVERNQQTLLASTSTLHATTHLIALADHMTKIALIHEDVQRKVIQN